MNEVIRMNRLHEMALHLLSGVQTADVKGTLKRIKKRMNYLMKKVENAREYEIICS